jgi:hypothetical protein
MSYDTPSSPFVFLSYNPPCVKQVASRSARVQHGRGCKKREEFLTNKQKTVKQLTG